MVRDHLGALQTEIGDDNLVNSSAASQVLYGDAAHHARTAQNDDLHVMHSSSPLGSSGLPMLKL
jgi:hypothetical protein